MTDVRQEFLDLLENSAADLDGWVKKQGLTVEEVCQMFIGILRENGIAARMILNKAAEYISVPAGTEITPDAMIKAIEAIRSRQLPAAIPEEGEPPSPAQQSALKQEIKNALPDFRDDLLTTAKAGPQHRRGGRPEELPDPVLRRQIREEIKNRRESDSTLSRIFEELGHKYRVSASKIKQVWLEKEGETPAR